MSLHKCLNDRSGVLGINNRRHGMHTELSVVHSLSFRYEKSVKIVLTFDGACPTLSDPVQFTER